MAWQLKARFPRLRINVITRHPELLEHAPSIHEINAPPTLLLLTFWYPELVEHKAAQGSIMDATSRELGGLPLAYRARLVLTAEERAWGLAQVSGLPGIRIAFNTKSKEIVKDWPEDRWAVVLRELVGRGISMVQLGDDREPVFPGVTRLAGRLTLRESMAVLAATQLHLGPDSFLMHAANGLDVPSVIIFGGSRPAACLGYAGNENLDVVIDCGPCWLHSSKGESCPHALACLRMIDPAQVVAAADRLLARGGATAGT